MSVNIILDWQKSSWSSICGSHAEIPHAMLLTGPRGIGKEMFAEALGQKLLCENVAGPESLACGNCPSCRWYVGEQHPDIRRVVPEIDQEDDSKAQEEQAPSETGSKKKSEKIKIEQIRGLFDFVYVGSHRGNRRLVIINPIESMTTDAANSILKILEEPPASVYFIMINEKIGSVIPTIVSRSRIISISRPDAEAAKKWLRSQKQEKALALLPITGNAPLLALEESEKGRDLPYRDLLSSLSESRMDAVSLAGQWESRLNKSGKETGFRMEELVSFFQKWACDLAVFRSGGKLRFFPGSEDIAAKLTSHVPLGDLLRFSSELVQIRRLSNHPLNPRLVLDDMAARYVRALTAGST